MGENDLNLLKSSRKDFRKDLASEGRLEDPVRVCQELTPLGRAQQRVIKCTKWQRGKAWWLWELQAWPGRRRVGIYG